MNTLKNTREHTIALLTAHNIPFQQWPREGKGTLATLISWIRSGEARLEERRRGLILHINVSVIAVRYGNNGTWKQLCEDRHVHPNGTSRRRKFNGHPGEKIHTLEGESDREAAIRGLHEELQFPKDGSGYQLIDGRMEVSQPRYGVSDYYPGLTDVYHRHFFTCLIPSSLYVKDGYQEVKNGHVIHFLWKKGWW